MTLPVSTPCWFDSTEAGAPTLNNATGSLLEILRACLINGFGSVSVTSIIVASGVATVTAATHGFSATYGKLVLIEGAPEALLNGRKRIGNVLTNSFTYPAPGVADGTYTGTITAKRAPLGWTEPHTGTNVAMFARSAPEANGQLLRVNDSHAAGSTATDARWLMVGSASGVDTFADPAPTEAQLAGGQYVNKGTNSAAAKAWAVFGNDRFFWIATQVATLAPLQMQLHCFGDAVPYLPSDPSFTLVGGSVALLNGGAAGNGACDQNDALTAVPSSMHKVLHRGHLAPATPVSCLFSGVAGPAKIGGNSPAVGIDTAAVAIQQPVYIQDQIRFVRGEVPGMGQPLVGLGYSSLQLVPATAPSGKVFVAVRTVSGSVQGVVMIDVTGPWF